LVVLSSFISSELAPFSQWGLVYVRRVTVARGVQTGSTCRRVNGIYSEELWCLM